MTEAPLPTRRYADGVARGDWLHDPAQQGALQELDRIHAALLEPVPKPGPFARLFGAQAAPAPRISRPTRPDATSSPPTTKPAR